MKKVVHLFLLLLFLVPVYADEFIDGIVPDERNKELQELYEQHVQCCLSFIRDEEIGSECEDFDLDSSICLTLTIELLDESELQRQQEIFEQHVQCCISKVKGEEIGSECQEFDLDEKYDSVSSLCEVLVYRHAEDPILRAKYEKIFSVRYGKDQKEAEFINDPKVLLIVFLAIIAWLIIPRKKKKKK